jgi:hypothetical protein
MKGQLSDAWRAKLNALYAPGNHYLVQEFSLPLQTHGYAT